MAWKRAGKDIQGGAFVGSSGALTRALGAVFGTTIIGYGIIAGFVVGSALLSGELLATSIVGGIGSFLFTEEISPR